MNSQGKITPDGSAQPLAHITEVAGQSQVTLEAKRRDLDRFLAFSHQLDRYDRPEEWCVSVTTAFLKHLREQRVAQAFLVHICATVRHFARRLHGKFPGPLSTRLPYRRG